MNGYRHTTIRYAVILDKAPPSFLVESFPRGLTAKWAAEGLVNLIKEKGGEAHLVPKKDFTPELIKKLRA